MQLALGDGGDGDLSNVCHAGKCFSSEPPSTLSTSSPQTPTISTSRAAFSFPTRLRPYSHPKRPPQTLKPSFSLQITTPPPPPHPPLPPIQPHYRPPLPRLGPRLPWLAPPPAVLLHPHSPAAPPPDARSGFPPFQKHR
ncbi:hypothetical protein FF1_013978 [Malus domestica]